MLVGFGVDVPVDGVSHSSVQGGFVLCGPASEEFDDIGTIDRDFVEDLLGLDADVAHRFVEFPVLSLARFRTVSPEM